LANGNLNRRLDRLEASMLPRNQRVLQITVTSIGEPDRTIELNFLNRAGGDDLGKRTAPSSRPARPSKSREKIGADNVNCQADFP